MNTTRREFLKSVSTVAAAAAITPSAFAQAAAKKNIRLGYDNFAVRAFKWKAPRLIDYAAEIKCDNVFITDFGPFENFEDGYLKELRKMAADKGIEIWLGSWSICPTSKSFKKDWGTAEEHLALGIRMAKALGSPVFRVVLGNGEDRKTEGGIDARIADTVKVLKSQRSNALDAGVKIAMENHAGDMHSTELVRLIEEAGKDFVGANMDSGNAVWTYEDPLQSLERLGPYAVCTSLRDSAVWESANGATAQWTAMGDGTLDLRAYFKRYAELCPKVPVHIETISGFNRELAYKKPEFKTLWPKMPEGDLEKFIALAKKGRPRAPHANPPGVDRAKAEQDYQRDQVERSIKYCREQLGLGVRA